MVHTATRHVALTDEEVIRQVLPTQPNQCFESLYNRYVSKVYQYCLSMTQDSENAQDFTHDIFLKAFGKLDAFQQRSSFATWLYSISYNYCLDQLRLGKRLSTTSIDDTLQENIADSTDTYLHEEALQLVSRAMERLSISEQAILKLKYEDGRSIEEIAQFYSIKVSAVKMRLKRSREKIRLVHSQLPDL